MKKPAILSVAEEKHYRQRFMNTKSLSWGEKAGAVEKLEKVKYNWSV